MFSLKFAGREGCMLTRRDFSKFLLASGPAALVPRALAKDSVWPATANSGDSTQNKTHENQPAARNCDLLIKGGTVIDPSQHLHATMDVAVRAGKILEVSSDIPESRAARVISAKNRIVTPGFIDLQVHCYEGAGGIGVNADHYCLGRGVTTAVENGAAGYLNVDGFIKYIVHPSITRVFTSINIFPMGLINRKIVPGQDDLKSLDPGLAAEAAERYRPATVGIKVYPEKFHLGENDLEGVRRSIAAAEECRMPLVADLVDTYSPLSAHIKLLRKGDVFTHAFNNHPNGLFDTNGKILPEVLEARDRGVYFDTAQGQDKFNFDVMEKCLQQNLVPDAISTDLYTGNVDSMVYDLPTTVSKFLALGMKLDDAIERVTARPAKIFDFGVQIGSLRRGSEADISICELQQGTFEFTGDSPSDKRTGHQMLVSKAVVCRGKYFVNAA
jgi:dihydroorotase